MYTPYVHYPFPWNVFGTPPGSSSPPLLHRKRADQLLTQLAVFELIARDATHLQAHVARRCRRRTAVAALRRSPPVAHLQFDLQTTRILQRQVRAGLAGRVRQRRRRRSRRAATAGPRRCRRRLSAVRRMQHKTHGRHFRVDRLLDHGQNAMRVQIVAGRRQRQLVAFVIVDGGRSRRRRCACRRNRASRQRIGRQPTGHIGRIAARRVRVRIAATLETGARSRRRSAVLTGRQLRTVVAEAVVAECERFVAVAALLKVRGVRLVQLQMVGRRMRRLLRVLMLVHLLLQLMVVMVDLEAGLSADARRDGGQHRSDVAGLTVGRCRRDGQRLQHRNGRLAVQ